MHAPIGCDNDLPVGVECSGLVVTFQLGRSHSRVSLLAANEHLVSTNYSQCGEFNECNMLRTQIKSGKIVVEDDLYDLLSPTRVVVENETIDDFAALSQ